MIKNGFLQQSAFDDIDMYSVPEKQIQILSIIMEWYERSLAIIKSGAPLSRIVALKSRDEIIRIKTSFGNEDLAGIRAAEDRMNDELDGLEKLYRKGGAV
jgi:V/A-type H+-transporting ATPase subunit A